MATVDEDLSQLESDIRRLKIEYEQYFGGGRQRPPSDTQWRVEQMVKRYAERSGEINFGQRFRYNNLAQTYAKYQEMWRKKLAQKETGFQHHHFGAAARAIEAERARLRASQEARIENDTNQAIPERPAIPAESFFAASFENPEVEPEKVESLYKKLIEVREQTGDKTAAPTLAAFEKFVRKKTEDLKQKGSRGVEYVVTIEGGRVKLKARVVAP